MVHKKSGFSIDPYHGDDAAALMADFFEGAARDPQQWHAISRGSLERVKAKCAARQLSPCFCSAPALAAAQWQSGSQHMQDPSHAPGAVAVPERLHGDSYSDSCMQS